MPSTVITAKGRITIPATIRQKLRLQPGDRVAFWEDAEGRILVEAENLDLLSLYGILKPRKRLSAEAINETGRKRVLGRIRG